MASRRERPDTLFLLGAVCWIVLGVGHLVIVDVLTIWLGVPIFTLDQNQNLFDIMGDTNIAYDWFLGSANMLRAFKGFSLWLAFSVVALGVLSLVIVRDLSVPDSTRARVAMLNAVAILAFAVLSWVCFINPPRFLPIVGAVAFMLAARGFRLRNAPGRA